MEANEELLRGYSESGKEGVAMETAILRMASMIPFCYTLNYMRSPKLLKVIPASHCSLSQIGCFLKVKALVLISTVLLLAPLHKN